MQYRNLDAKDVSRRASGRWDIILHALCPDLGDILASPRKHHPCPVHTGIHGDAVRLFDDFVTTGGLVCNSCGKFASGFDVLMWLFDWDFPTALKQVNNEISGGVDHVEQIRRVNKLPSPIKASVKDDNLIQRNLLDTWNGSFGLGNPEAQPARNYFANRGLIPMNGPLSDLRFQPRLAYWEFNETTKKQEHIGDYPGLIAMVRQPDGKPATLHRIYLTPDGFKAGVASPKKQMQTPSFRSVIGSAIRLDPAADVLHVTEGVETALAVRMITASMAQLSQTTHGTWSCLSTSLLAHLKVVAPTRIVCVWVDHDRNGAGRVAADKCVENLRLQGVRAILVLPSFALRQDDTNIDWLEVLNRYGLEAIWKLDVIINLSRMINREFSEMRGMRAAS